MDEHKSWSACWPVKALRCTKKVCSSRLFLWSAWPVGVCFKKDLVQVMDEGKAHQTL